MITANFTTENFTKELLRRAGMNGGNDAGVSGLLGGDTGFIFITCEDDEEINYDNDPEVDIAIQLDEIIHPLPTARYYANWGYCKRCDQEIDPLRGCGCPR